MTVTIDTDAVINSILLTDQGSNPSAPGAGKKQLFTKASGLYFIDSNGAVSGPLGNFLTPGGRLTLTSGTAVTTSDVTAATSIWYQPKDHNICPVWDGSKVIPLEFDATPLSLSGLSGTASFDVFGYSNAGTFALDYTMWTSPTARAVPLVYQSGRPVKSGTPTRTYLGSFYSATGGQTDDSLTKRFVWNYYNRVNRNLYVTDGTTHNYTTGTYRSWNNDAAIRVQFICGVVEYPTLISLFGEIETCLVGVGYDVTNALLTNQAAGYNANAALIRTGGVESHYHGIGYHFYQAIEIGSPGATQSYIYLTVNLMG